MRNSKVRKRIAAGKLRLRLRDLRNLGPRSESLLARIGIHTPEQLRKRGALNAFLAMKRAGVTNSLNALWALIGALEPWPEGSDWRAVAKSDARLPMLLAVEAQDTAGAAPRAARSGPKKAKRLVGVEPDQGVFAGEAWAPGLPFEELPKRKR